MKHSDCEIGMRIIIDGKRRGEIENIDSVDRVHVTFDEYMQRENRRKSGIYPPHWFDVNGNRVQPE